MKWYDRVPVRLHGCVANRSIVEDHAQPLGSLHGYNSNSHGARPVRLIITTLRWIRTSRLSIQNSLLNHTLGTPRQVMGLIFILLHNPHGGVKPTEMHGGVPSVSHPLPRGRETAHLGGELFPILCLGVLQEKAEDIMREPCPL